ncbi:MAG: radical SAM protein [Candidatus Pacebacteria bacterium]|nr:radical SAM protein [Candidatus Paceibacterota bacterium]
MDGFLPKLAWLTTNHTCNLHCHWCYQREISGGEKVMPKKLVSDLICLLADLGLREVILIGGEPTIHPLFLTINEMLRGRGVLPRIITNSLRFSDRDFVRRAESAGVDTVITSVKGFSEEEYVKGTGIRGFAKVEQAIENLDNSGIKHRISITITSDTIASWQKIIAFMGRHQTKDYGFSFEKPCIIGDDVVFDNGLLPMSIAALIEFIIYPTLSSTGIPFKIDAMFPQCQLPNEFWEKLEREGKVFSGCHLMGHNSVIFDPDGQVLPCNHLITQPLAKFGIDFSTAEQYLAWRKNYAVSHSYALASSPPCERCAKCERWSKCGAGCRLFWLFKGPDVLLPQVLKEEDYLYSTS